MLQTPYAPMIMETKDYLERQTDLLKIYLRHEYSLQATENLIKNFMQTFSLAWKGGLMNMPEWYHPRHSSALEKVLIWTRPVSPWGTPMVPV